MNYPSYLDSIMSDSGAPLRSLFFDGVTGLPTLPLVLDSLRSAASQQTKLGIIFIDTGRLDPLEEEYGWEIVDQLLNRVRMFLDSRISAFPPLKLFSIHRVTGDNFLLILSSDEPSQPLTFEQVSRVSSQLEEMLNQHLAEHLSASIAPYARMFNGYSVLEYNSNIRFERLVSRAINQAFQVATSSQEKVRQGQIQQLSEVINGSKIRVLFQPIYKLSNLSESLGYEVLSRGPQDSIFESADFMFSLAGGCGLLTRLENLCQLQIMSVLKRRSTKGLVFINLEPSFLEHDQYQKLALFQSTDIDPRNFVLEITERIAITNYSMVSRALADIRKRGFRFAVDDVGNGYASLQSIAYLRPDFIKVNDTMVRGIASDFIKQEIVKTLSDMAERLSASLIAEGIEYEKDLQTLLELKVAYGQGYLLKRPSESLSE
ncbi:MAG TPA: bifunctional diguanylate cyclase/phosphodiesterase [Acidobacteriota bacterium]|nr:bifunctional diguanylate cyclase/phosphodiesterase [Acidobacteriota bacterium]